MDIVINVSSGNEQSSFQVFSKLRIFFDAVLEFDISFFINDFLDSVMFFTPPSVVHIVLVIARRGDSHFEKVRIDEHCSRRHESPSGMAEDTDLIDIDERMPVRQLLDGRFFIGESIIS